MMLKKGLIDLTKADQMIARAIIAAQVASDRGKHITSELNDLTFVRSSRRMGYDVKVDLIYKALSMITNTRRSMFNYYCVKEPDQNGCDSVLVYFDFKMDGERHQVSFHNPYNQAKKLYKFIGTGRRTRWNKSLSGSRMACVLLSKVI